MSTALLPAEAMTKLSSEGFVCDAIPFVQTQIALEEPSRTYIHKLQQQKAIVIFTSAQAVQAVASCCLDQKPDWQVYCISGATRKAVASFLGSEKIIAVADDAVDLLQALAQITPQVITFFCGDKRLDTLPNGLQKMGFQVTECHVYTTQLSPVQVGSNYDAVLFFSPSGIESFLRVNTLSEHTTLFAIGKTTAKALMDQLPNPVQIAAHPDKNILVETVLHFYKTHL